MHNLQLFRREAVEHNDSGAFGKIVLLQPLSFSVISMAAALIAAGVLGLLCFGEYTQKAKVSGVLAADQDVIEVLTQQAGTVRECRVSEGQRIRRGDVLFVVSAERRSAFWGDMHAAISHSVVQRRDALRGELQKQSQLQDEERTRLQRQIAAVRVQHEELEAQIALQEQRLQFFSQTLARFEKLRADGFISTTQLQDKREEGLHQQAELHELKRTRATIASDLVIAEADLAALPLKAANQRSAIEREIAMTEEELASNEGSREIAIVASQDGVITNLQGEVGTTAGAGTTLASILPEGAILEAHLFVPSRAIGFIEPGRTVQLQYSAYPYQKFGQYEGRVKSVSRTTIDPHAQDNVHLGEALESSPHYLVTVELASQSVRAYGRDQPLQLGMQVDASVLLDRRSLIEWAFEPLFTISGRM